MPKYPAILLAMTAATVFAQTPEASGTYTQAQPAPIQRGSAPAPHRNLSGITTQQPAQGIYIRVGAGGSVSTVSKTPDHVGVRVDRGVANVSVHQPASGTLILVNLPGGQVDLLKDGFYTFNATANTVHVLKGEARAFPAASGDKGVKVKEYQQFSFTGAARSTDLDPMQARADVLPFARPGGGDYRGDRPGYYGVYGTGFYPAYYGYGYPYGFYGGPFFGVGFGYGFYGGYGFRGGHYGGFRGRW